MLKAEKIGKLTSVVAAIYVFSLFIIPISAYYISPIDWGWGVYSSGTITNSTIPKGCNISPSNNVFSNNNNRIVINKVGFTAQSGYTYTYTGQFKIDNFSEYYKLCTGNQLLTIGYCYSNTPTSSSSSYIYYKYDGTITTSLVSITKIEDDNYQIKLVYNPDSSGLIPGDIYLYSNIFYKIGYDTPTTAPSFSNLGVEVVEDIDGTVFEKILVDEISKIGDNQEDFYTNALEVLDSIKTGVDNLPENIHNVLTQVDQEEKSEASTEGNDNINQATSALTNALPIASIKDAITPLITACSYNGITSVWSFPALKIPAIQGLFGEMQLSEQQNFDLCAYADQYIPDELLSIIRAVMTILLIVWAIREVMNLLSHLLGGGDG